MTSGWRVTVVLVLVTGLVLPWGKKRGCAAESGWEECCLMYDPGEYFASDYLVPLAHWKAGRGLAAGGRASPGVCGACGADYSDLQFSKQSANVHFKLLHRTSQPVSQSVEVITYLDQAAGKHVRRYVV